MAYLDTQPALGYPLAAAVGLAVGSFLNVVILRLPRRLEWEWKREARTRWGGRALRAAERIAVRDADAVVTDGQGVADYYDDEFGVPAEVVRPRPVPRVPHLRYAEHRTPLCSIALEG